MVLLSTVIEVLDWLWAKGGLPLIVAALAILFAFHKERQWHRAWQEEHKARIREAKESAIIFHSLLKRHGRSRTPTLPDFEIDEEPSGIIDVLGQLQTQAKRELDSDITELLKEYLEENGAATPRPAVLKLPKPPRFK